jgi:protein required for attachment to host cells
MPITWVVAADSAQADIYRVGKIGGSFEPVKSLSNAEGQLKGKDLITDKPGRAFDSMGAGRHAMKPSVGPKEHAADLFARDVCQFIETARTRGQYDRLIVLAPPDFLGRLRKSISPAANQLVVESVAKNLVGQDADAIRARLETVL